MVVADLGKQQYKENTHTYSSIILQCRWWGDEVWNVCKSLWIETINRMHTKVLFVPKVVGGGR